MICLLFEIPSNKLGRNAGQSFGPFLSLQFSHLGQDKDVGMVPDPAQVLDVIEEAALLSSLELPVGTNLARFCIVLQIEPAMFWKIKSIHLRYVMFYL